MDSKRLVIAKKVEQMFIMRNPQLAIPEYRKGLTIWEKGKLVGEMMAIANKLLILNI